MSSVLTFCISTFNNLHYLKLAVESVRKNSHFKDAPFIIHAENCTDGTNEWLEDNKERYNLTIIIEPDNQVVRGIGGGMNICAENVDTEFILFLHSDFYVTKDWDLELLKIHRKYSNEKLWVNPHRVEPNMFNSPDRPGTILVPKDFFGEYYHNFNSDLFEQWASEFVELNDFEIPKGEGVSGLVKKELWDAMGGNDPRFSPASWEDMDLFLRMLQYGVRFVLPSKSLVWHFGARGSHRLEENDGRSSQRQRESEEKNVRKWLEKWNKMPIFDSWGMIKDKDEKGFEYRING
jgi:GT2 family glycosyltransferase